MDLFFILVVLVITLAFNVCVVSHFEFTFLKNNKIVLTGVVFHHARFMYNKVHGKPQFHLEAIDEEEDKDVQAERERVTLGLADCDMLQLQNLTKIYHLPHRRIVAVKNVSIGIPAGEVSRYN